MPERGINIETGIEALKFLKEHVFTSETIEEAVKIGKSLGEILGEAYDFVMDVKALAADTRSLDIDRQLHDAGVADLVKDLER